MLAPHSGLISRRTRILVTDFSHIFSLDEQQGDIPRVRFCLSVFKEPEWNEDVLTVLFSKVHSAVLPIVFAGTKGRQPSLLACCQLLYLNVRQLVDQGHKLDFIRHVTPY